MQPQGGEGAGRELPGAPFRGTRLSASLSGHPRPGQPGLAGSEEPPHAARSSAHGGPGRRVTDRLLPAANRRRSRGRRDFIHSFIKKKRSAAGKRALPGWARGGPRSPPHRASARTLTAVGLVAVIRAVVVLVAFPDGGDASLVPALELVLLALLDGACETRDRAWVSGARSHNGVEGTPRGRLPNRPRTSPAGRREPAAEGGGWGWARRGRAARCGAGGDAPPREDGDDPEAALCRDKRDRSRASPHCFKDRGERSLGIEDS